MHVQSCCFANLNLLLFCRSCCRRRLCCFISCCLHDVDCFRKYRSQNATNVFAELDEEAVTGVDCDGVVFDPSNFKAVREVSLYRHVVFLYYCAC